MPGRLAVSLGMLSSTDDEPHYLPNGHALLMAMWNLLAWWFGVACSRVAFGVMCFLSSAFGFLFFLFFLC